MVWLWNGGRLLDAKKRLGRCGVWGRDRKKEESRGGGVGLGCIAWVGVVWCRGVELVRVVSVGSIHCVIVSTWTSSYRVGVCFC